MAVQRPSRVRASGALDSPHPLVGRREADHQQGEDRAPQLSNGTLARSRPHLCSEADCNPTRVEGLVRSLKEEGMDGACGQIPGTLTPPAGVARCGLSDPNPSTRCQMRQNRFQLTTHLGREGDGPKAGQGPGLNSSPTSTPGHLAGLPLPSPRPGLSLPIWNITKKMDSHPPGLLTGSLCDHWAPATQPVPSPQNKLVWLCG